MQFRFSTILRRRLAALAFVIAGSLASAPTTVSAQSQTFDIAPQPLSIALLELGKAAGLTLLFDPELAAGRQGNQVAGDMSADAALSRMLAGTGLTYTYNGSGVVQISQAPQQTAAESAAEDDDLLGEDIIVQGELIDRSVQDSQTSAVIITGEELDQRGETELGQALRRVPGVSEGNNPVIRGVNSDGGLGNATTNSTISITADGIRFSDYRNTDSNQISTWDLQQVEVLRGPQSTQSGRNALVGAIIVESADPEYTPEYKLRLGAIETQGRAGEDSGFQAAFVLNTPLIEDQIALRLSADKRRNIDGSSDLQTIRGKLRLDPMEDLSLGVAFTHISNTVQLVDGGAVLLEMRSPSLTVDYNINDALTLSSRTQYTAAEPSFFAVIPSLNATALRDRDYETIEQEVQLAYDTDDVRAIGGLFYTNLSENSLLEVTQAFGRSTLVEDIQTTNYAIYGEVEYDLSSYWTLIAGARYDVEEVKNTSTASVFLPNGFPIATSTGSFDNTYSAFLPKVGVIYNFDEDISLGATFQRGYRAGGVGVAVGPTSAPFTFQFDPEFTDTFELAFRSQSSDGDRILNANVFYTRWTDQQVLNQDAVGNNFVSNAAKSKLWGAELEVSQFVTDDLELFASAAYANTKYDDYVLGGVQLAGNEFPFAPEWKASIGANYTFPNGISIGGDVNYTSSTFSDGANTPALQNDGFWLFNLNASYTFENGAELTAYARNLFDKDYTTQISPTGPAFNGIGPPREFGALLTVNF